MFAELLDFAYWPAPSTICCGWQSVTTRIWSIRLRRAEFASALVAG